MNKSAVFWFEFFSKRFGPAACFFKHPESFRGPKANFKIKTFWIVVQFLAHKPVSFASLIYSFIVSFSKLSSVMKGLGPVSRKSGKRFGPGKLFCVCRVCIYEQSFSNFENDTIKLSVVKKTKLTGLWACHYSTRFDFKNLPPGPKSFRAFRKTGPRRPFLESPDN